MPPARLGQLAHGQNAVNQQDHNHGGVARPESILRHRSVGSVTDEENEKIGRAEDSTAAMLREQKRQRRRHQRRRQQQQPEVPSGNTARPKEKTEKPDDRRTRNRQNQPPRTTSRERRQGRDDVCSVDPEGGNSASPTVSSVSEKPCRGSRTRRARAQEFLTLSAKCSSAGVREGGGRKATYDSGGVVSLRAVNEGRGDGNSAEEEELTFGESKARSSGWRMCRSTGSKRDCVMYMFLPRACPRYSTQCAVSKDVQLHPDSQNAAACVWCAETTYGA